MVFAAVERASADEAADLRGKRAAFDTEKISQLLAVERNVEFATAALLGKRMEVGKQAVFCRAVGKDVDFRVQLERLCGNDAHLFPWDFSWNEVGFMSPREQGIPLKLDYLTN